MFDFFLIKYFEKIKLLFFFTVFYPIIFALLIFTFLLNIYLSVSKFI